MSVIKRNTTQRKIILDTLKRYDTHPTAETLYAEILKEHPTISRATIYRNLRQLVDAKQIAQLAIANSAVRYDGNANPHYHFSCKICGGVSDVDMSFVTGVSSIGYRKHGFVIDKHDVTFTGICPNCN